MLTEQQDHHDDHEDHDDSTDTDVHAATVVPPWRRAAALAPAVVLIVALVAFSVFQSPHETARVHAHVTRILTDSGAETSAFAAAYEAAAQAETDRLWHVHHAELAAETARIEEAWRVAVITYRWTTVGRCEQPLPDGGIQWTLQSSVYSGGLGISNAAWVQWGGQEFAPNAGLATPWQQMLVAERIREAVGRGAWGCPVP